MATDSADRIESLLAQMTLEEKVTLTGGASMWETVPIPRLGIPAMRMTDGPNGARGSGSLVQSHQTAACFPSAISLASTWDTALVHEVGAAIAQEAKTKGASIVLGPTMNIHRSPLNGRNFECYSEDPFLSSRMAVAWIEGAQSEGIGATAKHFVANDSEYQRYSMSSDVDERTLHEIYLPPFHAAVTEAGSWAVMTGYNRLNGAYCSDSRWLVTDLLKETWGFDGMVISDWHGTYSTDDAANAGLDLEMPGPTRRRGQQLVDAVRAGRVDEAMVTDAARRILRVMERSGALDREAPSAEQAIDRPEHAALIRRAGSAGCVLLKNEGNLLPIDRDRIRTIAMIGPNAERPVISGGGSATVTAHHVISPVAGVVEATTGDVKIELEQGTTNHLMLPHLDMARVAPMVGGKPGAFSISYWDTLEPVGTPKHTESMTFSEQLWFGDVAPGIKRTHFSARAEGVLTPETGGAWTFSLASVGKSRLFVDDELVIDNWTDQQRGNYFFCFGSDEVAAEVDLPTGQPVRLAVEFSSEGTMGLVAFRVGALPPQPDDRIERAVEAARNADVVFLYVGTNAERESEGNDRWGLELPHGQDELIEAVAAANPRTVVVLQTGGPVAMPWLDEVPAVLQAWLPGQEAGDSIADVLFGLAEPGGRLPQTFPLRIEDNPAYFNYPGDNGHVRYGEGIFVGYRAYDEREQEVLFPFGFGLSYTTFAWGDLTISAEEVGPDGTVTVSVPVTNTGDRAGVEVVQVYVSDPVSRLRRPAKELKGFARLALGPGERGTAQVTLDRTAFAYYDDAEHAWVAEAGDFVISVGRSAHELLGREMVRLTETVTFAGP